MGRKYGKLVQSGGLVFMEMMVLRNKMVLEEILKGILCRVGNWCNEELDRMLPKYN